MAFTLRNNLNLLLSIAASVAIHMTLIEALSLSKPRASFPNTKGLSTLEISFVQQQTNVVTQKISGYPPDSGSKQSGQIQAATKSAPAPSKENLLSPDEGSMPIIENPKIRFVGEINLDDASDLERDGYVEVELLISADGNVIRSTLISTDIPNEFYELVAQTFKVAVFFPGKRNGLPVAEKLRFKVFFSKSVAH